MEIIVLRLGHRLPRDERISTHVALVARAFGAKGMVYSGQHDSGLETSVTRLAENWGGDFAVSYEKNYRKTIKNHKENGFTIVHLTMYGLPLPETLRSGPWAAKMKPGKLLIIVGSEAVPGDVYQFADFNVSVTGQPHSEVAALAIILDRLMEGKELEREAGEKFRGRIAIEPSERGKRVSELR